MKDITNNLKKFGIWKIYLTVAVNFISSKYSDQERAIHYKSDNIEILINGNAVESIEEHFQSLLSRYHTGLGTSMNGSNFVFDYVC